MTRSISLIWFSFLFVFLSLLCETDELAKLLRPLPIGGLSLRAADCLEVGLINQWPKTTSGRNVSTQFLPESRYVIKTVNHIEPIKRRHTRKQCVVYTTDRFPIRSFPCPKYKPLIRPV